MPEENLDDLSREELIEKIQELEQEEEVVFFEPEREIVLSHPDEETLNEISEIAHMETSSGEFYKFQVRNMDLWNSSLSLEEMKEKYTRILGNYPRFLEWVERMYERQEVFSIEHAGTYHVLKSTDRERMEWARSIDDVRENLSVDLTDKKSRIAMGSNSRAKIKEVLLKKGYPVEDNSKFREVDEKIGADLTIDLRDYQEDYVQRAHEKKAAVLANPAGSGKTVTAIGLMAKIDAPTLILVPQRSLIKQWKREILDKTTVTEDQIGEYHGGEKEMGDITLATYHMAAEKTSPFREDWGLIIFDECLTGDTVIETPEGRKSFKELDEELELEDGWNRDVSLEVRSFENGYTWDDVKGVYKTKSPVQKIKTNIGKELKATPGHTHVVLDPETFEIKDRKFVEEGDFLLQPLSETLAEEGESPQHELMGWFIGDGHINSNGNGKFSFSEKADEQIGIIQEFHEELDAEYTVFENDRGDLTLYSPDLQQIIDWDGIKQDKTSDVRVPAEIYNGSKSEIASLLRGLFDAEGSVDKKGRIQINTVSEKLADDIDLLLQKLGIMTRRQQIEREKEEHQTVHRLIIPTYYNDRFSDLIGFRMEHKQERVREGVEPATALPASNFLREVKEELNLPEQQMAEMMEISRTTLNGALKGEHRIGQSKLQKLGQSLREYAEKDASVENKDFFNLNYREVADTTEASLGTVYRRIEQENHQTVRKAEQMIQERQQKAQKYAERIEKLQDINLLEITEIEEIGKKTVYDLETESHRFLADGFLTHNCHHMPAKMFRKTADLQSTRRIGLSASPVREDNNEKEIYALIGQEIGGDWAHFFKNDFVLKPDVEIQFAEWANDHYFHKYNEASGIKKAIIASKNPAKKENLEELLEKHEDDKTIIFCDWIDQGEDLEQEYDIPFISGETDHDEREKYFQKFRDGELDTIIVSRIGDEGLDLPDAEVGIIMSGQGGSRRQATQRAGRVMRPFGDAQVYMIATKGSNEEDFVKQQVELLKEKGVPVKVKE